MVLHPYNSQLNLQTCCSSLSMSTHCHILSTHCSASVYQLLSYIVFQFQLHCIHVHLSSQTHHSVFPVLSVNVHQLLSNITYLYTSCGYAATPQCNNTYIHITSVDCHRTICICVIITLAYSMSLQTLFHRTVFSRDSSLKCRQLSSIIVKSQSLSIVKLCSLSFVSIHMYLVSTYSAYLLSPCSLNMRTM